MGIPGSANLLLAAAEAEPYQIEQSLRFDGSSYLSNTFSSSGNRETNTLSLWCKRSFIAAMGDNNFTLVTADPNNNYDEIGFTQNYGSTESDEVWYRIQGGYYVIPNGLFRDVSAWTHLVFRRDGTQSTAANRLRIYVNGAEATYRATNYQPQNQTWGKLCHSCDHRIGTYDNTYQKFEGYMAELHLVDGQSLGPDSFGEYDDNGVWRPIEYDGTYGTNGIYMKFDPSATNGIGHDHSGNGHHFTATNFTTSGGFTDVMKDTPTTNWCTLNPLAKTNSSLTLSEGNLKAVTDTTAAGNAYGTFAIPTSGKWYWEVTALGGPEMIGVAKYDATEDLAWTLSPSVFVYETGESYINGSGQTYGSSYTEGDVIGVACDTTAGTIQFYKNGAGMGSLSQSVGGLFPCLTDGSGSSAATYLANFGQREFMFPPGTYSAGSYFNVVTYNGNGSTKSVTGLGFQPDLVWIKYRDATSNNGLFDSVRGAGDSLTADTSNAKQTQTDSLTSFDSDGFSLGDNTEAGPDVNYRTGSYVAWCWKAGGTASSNTDGSQTASVSANDDAGFSVMTWNYSGSSSYTVGHGLSTAPKVLFVKKTDGSTNWFVRHGAIHTGNGALFLNTNTTGDSSSTVFNGTAPTDSVISLNGALTDVRGAHVCYAFAEKTGVSKFGSYTGNGSVDGPEVNDLGFAPALLVIKRTSGSSEWAAYDSARGNDTQLRWDQIDADNTNSAVNVRLTSNGFKIATSDAAQNANGDNYIYMAWARDFTVDGDYKALNTKNLPAPEIADGTKHFNTLLYTGNGTVPRSLTGVGFQPDWVWLKGRDGAYWHVTGDSVRGSDGVNGLNLNTNDSAFEGDENSGHVESWDSDGFTVEEADSGAYPLNNVNRSGTPYVAWNWKAGGTASSNTAGTITCNVSANASAGFSILTWTGTGAVGTLGHGLGVAPGMIIVKSRSIADDWYVFHSSLGATKRVQLNNDAVVTTGTSVWNSTSPTSTVFSIGNGNPNSSNVTYVAYCFAEVEGYSKISEFVGNGSTDGSFVYCGFKPSWILLRRYEASRNWYLYDATRDTVNVVGTVLHPDLTSAESTADALDIVSNGFKMRTTNTSTNGSGDKIMFIAFASNPFGGSGVSPATAR